MGSYTVEQFHDRATADGVVDTITVTGPVAEGVDGPVAPPPYSTTVATNSNVKGATIWNLGTVDARVVWAADTPAGDIDAPTFVQPVVGFRIPPGGNLLVNASNGAAGRTLVVKAVTAGVGRVAVEAEVRDQEPLARNFVPTLTTTGGSGGGLLDTEGVQAIIGTSVVAGSNVTVVYNPTTGTTTVASPPVVASVAGRTGAVTLAKADVGLSNVDNTSDVNKPVPSAVTTQLNLKQPIATLAETVQDLIGSSVVPGANIDVTYDDAEGTTTLSATAPSRTDALSWLSATATIEATPSDRAPGARTLVGVRMWVDGVAPAGSALIVQVQHSGDGGGTWSSVGTPLTLAANTVAEVSQTFTTPKAQVTGDRVRLNVTSVGSTTAATMARVDVLSVA